MRKLFFTFLMFAASLGHTDTIANYMHIADNIPRMEMKADPQAHAWARSARNVITITDESIVETITALNHLASKQGKPLFCLKKDTLNATMLDGIIRQTYADLSSQQSKLNQMTVSQIALVGLLKKYPCVPSGREKQMQRIARFTGNYH